MLPTTIDQINNLVMKNIIKTEFRSNSSLKINNYILDKNSRRLVYMNKSLELTEKEIDLIELLKNQLFNQKRKF